MDEKFNPINKIFTEKYRPKKVMDVISDSSQKIANYLVEPLKIPNFLLYSTVPGTGKTSLGKAIINELQCDYTIINSSDDRTIETVREKIKEFASVKSSNPNLKRCVMLDEVDGANAFFQNALRGIMEFYSNNCFFILTANNRNHIIEPIQSRCVLIPFSYPQKQGIKDYLTKICVAENIKYTEEAIDKLIEYNYPSIRNCVIVLQDIKTEGKDLLPEHIKSANAIFDDLWKLLQEKKWVEIKKVILETTIDARDLNTYFWQKTIKEENIDTKKLQIFCRNEKDMCVGSDPKIVFITSLIELTK